MFSVEHNTLTHTEDIMITLVQAQPTDAKICIGLMRKFRNSYNAKCVDTNNLNEKKVMLQDIARKAVFLIKKESKVIGIVDVMKVASKFNPKDNYNLIQNMFIETEHRRKGYAEQVRKELIKTHNVKGTVVTYARARELRDYYRSNGFFYIRPFPEYEFGGRDENLCILAIDKLQDAPKLFCNYDTEQSDWAQQLAQVITDKVLSGEMNNPQEAWLKRKEKMLA